MIIGIKFKIIILLIFFIVEKLSAPYRGVRVASPKTRWLTGNPIESKQENPQEGDKNKNENKVKK